MNEKFMRNRGTPFITHLMLAIVLFMASITWVYAEDLPLLTVIGVDPDGNETALTDFRWLVEENQTYHVPTDAGGKAMIVEGGVPVFDANWQQGNDLLTGGETLSVAFHDSYVPVVAKGCTSDDAQWRIDAACVDTEVPFVDLAHPVSGLPKRYYVSVVARNNALNPADPGYSIGGADYVPGVGATVYVHQYPIPTAQISILIFKDNNSINGAPDLPQEDPLTDADNNGVLDNPMAGFTIAVEDGGGRYGASAGLQSLDAFGNPLGTTYSDTIGTVSGFEPLVTGPDGRLTIKNLAPGKYGIQAIPPAGQSWQQTSTIEGTKIIDAWVKANEPPFFAEFGPAGFHVFIGFIQPFNEIPVPDGGSGAVTGKVVNLHMSRPPASAFSGGSCFSHTTPWVGLNEATGGLPGKALYAASTTGDCDFNIPAVPDGQYILSIWDTAKDVVIGFKGVTVAGGNVDLGDVPVFQWFHRQEHRVFNDENGDGVWDANEGPINDQATILRWRDGTVYQENVTDFTGAYTFDQVFPFFSWLVAEVDFARFEATGLTTVVDNGGPFPASAPGFAGEGDFTFGDTVAPQDQTNPVDPFCATGACVETTTYATQLGPVLTAGFQGFLGQTNAFLWGKRHYEDIEPGLAGNGGISGIVFYAITRAENDPATAAAEPWEPGIPGVTVNLWSSDGSTLLNSTTTDSWDDSIPTGCKWGDTQLDGLGNPVPFSFSPDGTNSFEQDCYDGLRVFNQVRPAVFDGGYAFDDVCMAGGLNSMVNFSTVAVESYAVGQDAGGIATVDLVGDPSGQTLHISANAWKKIAFDYNFTANTMLQFEYRSDVEGEIHGIGFDNNDAISQTQTFKLDGTQNWGNQTFDNYPTGTDVDGWQQFTIPVGALIPGLALTNPGFMTFTMDHDVASPTGESWFRNVSVYEAGATNVAGFDPVTGTCPDDAWHGYIPAANYIVEVVPPPGYEILKPEDKNVDFGDEYQSAALAALPVVPQCVGEPTLIPQYLTLFPDQQVESPFAWDTGSYVETFRPLCDRKEVVLTAGANGAADFWLFTEVPVAAHGKGFILDDTQNEFDPNSPNFGEKYAPPFVPVTIRDWTGRIIGKTLSDQYGSYNFLAPSTITTNLPAPSGMSPNMLTTCMNDPGDDPNSPDPNWNQQYSTFCYNFQYMPGVTTYLDTPVVPVAAFAGADQFQVDCEFPDGTPRIWEVQGDGVGPYVASAPGTITITSMGVRSVSNPQYCNPAAGACPTGADTTNKFIDRDYSFGTAAGEVWIGDLEIPAANVTWGSDTIIANLPASITTGQLKVVRGDNQAESVTSVTVQVGLRDGDTTTVHRVTPTGGPLAHDIQNAIDGAGSNDLVLVGCGVANEMVVMWKPVQLQGSGECTVINAVKAPTEKLQVWRDMVDGLVSDTTFGGYLLPGQETGAGAPEPTTLWTEEGAGILVLAKDRGPNRFRRNNATSNRYARIDGFTIRGADTGGGIVVNGYADYLQVSNNRISNNSGSYGGGIRVGHPVLTAVVDGVFDYTDGNNDFVTIHNNQVVFNGGLGGAGGGISMCTGADGYQITQNWVCGNFTLGEGGGIGHTGLSDRQGGTTPLIGDNTIIFNESFFQGSTVSGGGIFIGGAPALPAAPGGLTPGSGDVQVIDNLIKGNSAGAGDGGGIRLAGINGQDVLASRNPNRWHGIDIFNNMIVNNVTALAGGGISMYDAVKVRLVHNTIANNDSVAAAGEAFTVIDPVTLNIDPNITEPQDGAGIAARAHSNALVAAGNTHNNPLRRIGEFPLDPQKDLPGNVANWPDRFADNIVWQNRQFFFFVDASSGCTPGDPNCTSTFGVCPDVSGALLCPGGNEVVYNDLGVLGTAGVLTGTANLVTPDPWTAPVHPDEGTLFVAEYFNGARSSIFQPEINTGIQTPAAFDEGGNFIRLKYGPLALHDDATPADGDAGVLWGDYHIVGTSSAVDAGSTANLSMFDDLDNDFDQEPRPSGAGVDIGADEDQ